jgi:hypothetical protein
MGKARETFMGRRCRSQGARRIGLRANLRGTVVCLRAYACGQTTWPREAATIAAVRMT